MGKLKHISLLRGIKDNLERYDAIAKNVLKGILMGIS